MHVRPVRLMLRFIASLDPHKAILLGLVRQGKVLLTNKGMRLSS